jgi:hypothetical protein
MGLTVIVIRLERERVASEQPYVEVMTQLTMSPLFKELVVKTGLFGPTGVLLIYHWYWGFGPALLGVAVKVTVCPAQIVVALAVIVTVGIGCTVMVIGLEAKVPEQPVPEGLTRQRMTLPFVRVEEV